MGCHRVTKLVEEVHPACQEEVGLLLHGGRKENVRNSVITGHF